MAKKGKKGKKVEHHDMLEKPEALAEQISKTEQFIEKHQTLLLSFFGVIALVIAGGFLYKYYMNNQNELAQDEMFQAVYYFEQDSLNLALRGDGNRYGFLDIIEEYGATEAGNLANFYAGACYMGKGAPKSAIPFLKDYKSDDILLMARAYSLLGDAYMDEDDYAEAADYYSKAASYKPNKEFTPTYIMKAALAYELNGQQKKAVEQYNKIIQDYANTPEYNNARKYKALIENKS
ncbi:MAG: tetratricopeptide repeat protein [Bacteroidota bacterium]